MNPLEITLLVIAILVGYPLIWMLVCLLLSRMSGWKKLAEKFPATGNETGKTFRFQGAYIGWVRYNGALTFLVSPNGLGLSIIFPFRAGHPALFIPWDEFHNIKQVQKFMHKFVVMDAGDPVIVQLTLPRWILDEYPKQV